MCVPSVIFSCDLPDHLAVLQGIVPTLIIVRVGLGISTDDVESSVATIRAAENGRDITTLGRAVFENAVLDIAVAEAGGPAGLWVSDGGSAKAEAAETF